MRCLLNHTFSILEERRFQASLGWSNVFQSENMESSGEISQSVKHLPYKHEEPEFDPQNPCEKLGTVTLRRQGKEMMWALSAASLA